jgi:hypothetical protein
MLSVLENYYQRGAYIGALSARPPAEGEGEKD